MYHFFGRQDSGLWSIGYLVKENIEGVTLEQGDWDDLDLSRRGATALDALHSILSD